MTVHRVLGIGSPFGDDKLGWEVIKRLQLKTSLYLYIPHYLQLTCCDRPGMHLLELMRGAERVFIIDAVKTGADKGTLHRFANEEIKSVSHALSTHGLGVAEAMTMGSILNELPEQVILYGIEIGDVVGEFSLSEPIMRAVETLSKRIEKDVLLSLGKMH